MKKRLSCLLLALSLLLILLGPSIPVARAAQKKTPTRAIGIVFDNSGSMYMNGNTAWCQATYAMEVFAAMMNEGDTLRIFPMVKIEVNGKSYERGTAQPYLTINGPEESSVIRDIYTPSGGGTPVESIDSAFEEMQKVSADEKYLIVLTDGNTFHKNGVEQSASKTKQLLEQKMDQIAGAMNVMYLGIGVSGSNKPVASNPDRQYYLTTDSADTPKNLAAMCNRIFGRNTLPDSFISGNTVEVDVSISKMIVFVQGENISNVQLSGGTKRSEQTTRYSEKGAGAWYGNNGSIKATPDTTLQGMMVTYENLDAGTYDLSFSGQQRNISVYYEPDVDLQVLFQGEGGTVDPAKDELYAGTYNFTFQMVDKNGNPTDSVLLGDVNYDVWYTVDGEKKTANMKGNGSIPIELKAGSELDAGFTVRYLDGYSIYKDSKALGWPDGGIQIGVRPAGDTRLEVSGGSRSYLLSELEQEAVYNVALYYEGQKVIGDGFNAVGPLEVKLDGGNAKIDVQQTGEGWTVSLKYNGTAAETQTGDQTLTFQTSYTNEDDQTAQSNVVQKEFEIEDDSMALKLKIRMDQDYYNLTALEDAEPIILRLTAGGDPLSKEQFDAAKVQVTVGGKTVTAQPDAAGSAYIVPATELAGLEPGKHVVKAVVEGIDTLGHPAHAEDTDKLEVQNYPVWVRWLFWILLIALIIFLICAYLNAKRLPKSAMIVPDSCVFTVDGETVTGDPSIKKPGFGQKKGSLTVQSPDYMLNPLALCGFTLDVVANTPRKVRSASRNAQVVNVRAADPNTTMVMIGGSQFLMDPEKGMLYEAGTDGSAPIDFSIGGTTNFVVMSEIQSMDDSSTVTCSLSGEFEFL